MRATPVSSLPAEIQGWLDTVFRVVDPWTGAEKDQSLVRMDLVPDLPMIALGALYGYGANKYAPNNWRLGYDWSLSMAALERHWRKWKLGEDIDPVSGMHHLASVIFHAMALIEYRYTHPEKDDRYKEPAA